MSVYGNYSLTLSHITCFSSVQFSRSVVCDSCDPMNPSTPGLPVHHQLPEFTQTHVHRGSDAIQPSQLGAPWAPSASVTVSTTLGVLGAPRLPLASVTFSLSSLLASDPRGSCWAFCPVARGGGCLPLGGTFAVTGLGLRSPSVRGFRPRRTGCHAGRV